MMQAGNYKNLLSLSIPVVAVLAISFPEVTYPENGAGLSSAYRGLGGSKGSKRGNFRGSRNITGYSGLGTSKKRSAYGVRQKKSTGRSVSRPHADSISGKESYSAKQKIKSTGNSVNQVPRKQLATTESSVSTMQNTKSTRHSVNFSTRSQLATVNAVQNYNINEKIIKKPVPVTVKKNTAGSINHKKHSVHAQSKHHKHKAHHGHRKHHKHSSSSVFFSFGGHYYPYHYYPHSYYSGYYDYDYPFYSPYGYTSDYDYYEKPVYATSKDYMDSPGWDLLAQRNFEDAINVFLKDIQLSSDHGIPKVGLALAMAAKGNLTEAIQPMRDAFRFDADSTRYLYFDTAVLTIINELIEKYNYQSQASNNIDDVFMVSALLYLKYDYDNAHVALNRASLLGDRGPGIGNLHRLIDDQLSGQYAGNRNQ